MIDYEKLKLAHELAKKYSALSGKHIELTVAYYQNEKPDYCLEIYEDNGNYSHDKICLEEIISKLQELTQDKPKPKYEVGQTVWVNKLSIINVEIFEVKGNKYFDGDDWYAENELYSSKQALIEAQIEYWTDLKHKEKPKIPCCVFCSFTLPEDMICRRKECIAGSSEAKYSLHPPFEGEAKGLSSCCSIHAGTTEECAKECHKNSPKAGSKLDKCLVCDETYWKEECFDIQRHQDEVDLHECQHESDGGWHIHYIDEMLGKINKCKHCGEFYN